MKVVNKPKAKAEAKEKLSIQSETDVKQKCVEILSVFNIQYVPVVW